MLSITDVTGLSSASVGFDILKIRKKVDIAETCLKNIKTARTIAPEHEALRPSHLPSTADILQPDTSPPTGPDQQENLKPTAQLNQSRIDHLTEDYEQKIKQALCPVLEKIDQLEKPMQLLHVLAHVNGLQDISNYFSADSASKASEIIQDIDDLQSKFGFDPYETSEEKFRFITILRDELINRLPSHLRVDFTQDDTKVWKNTNSRKLAMYYEGLTAISIQKQLRIETGEKPNLSSDEITTTQKNPLDDLLKPLNNETREWSHQQRYLALFHMMGFDLHDLDKTPISARPDANTSNWVNQTIKIRQNHVDKAPSESRNELRIFFNNTLRSGLVDQLPTEFRGKYNAIWDKFNDTKNTQAFTYEDAKKATWSLIEEYLNKQ